MTRSEVHQELTLLGVSSEIHNLVDDLDLDLGRPNLAFRLLLKTRHIPETFKNVYTPHQRHTLVQGRLFED